MIDISGHFRDIRRDIGFEDLKRPLMINCCGYQSFHGEDFSRQRPEGRLDYQLIYVYKGYGEYYIDNHWQRMPAGSLIVYAPKEPQIYTYRGADAPEIYWLHFTGTECEKIVRGYNLKNGSIGDNPQLKNLFQEIILELQLKKAFFEDIVNSSFYKIAVFISRAKSQSTHVPEYNFALERLIIQLNQDYRNHWSVGEMAEFCHLSEDYFAHSFKNTMKMTPVQYLTRLRIEKAKDMLQWEGMNIASVASFLGYDDPLYFSRVFKKITGASPMAYRRNQLLPVTSFPASSSAPSSQASALPQNHKIAWNDWDG